MAFQPLTPVNGNNNTSSSSGFQPLTAPRNQSLTSSSSFQPLTTKPITSVQPTQQPKPQQQQPQNNNMFNNVLGGVGHFITQGIQGDVELAKKAVDKIVNTPLGNGPSLSQTYSQAMNDLHQGSVSYAPAENNQVGNSRQLQQQQKQVNVSDPVRRLGTDAADIMMSTLQGATNGLFKNPIKNLSAESHIIEPIAKFSGQLYSITKLSEGFGGLLNKTPIAKAFPKGSPLDYIPGVLKNVGAFGVYDQLNPDVKNRVNTLIQSEENGTLFGVLGVMGKLRYSIPLAFSGGVGLAKLNGASDKDALKSGILFAALDGAGKLPGLFQSEFKNGTKEFSPQEARDFVMNSPYKNTEFGKNVMKDSFTAEASGQNMKVTLTAAKQGAGARLFNMNGSMSGDTPHGTQISYQMVDQNANTLLNGGKTNAEESPINTRSEEPVSVKTDFSQSPIDHSPTAERGILEAGKNSSPIVGESRGVVANANEAITQSDNKTPKQTYNKTPVQQPEQFFHPDTISKEKTQLQQDMQSKQSELPPDYEGQRLTPFDTKEIIDLRNEAAKQPKPEENNSPERLALRDEITNKLYGTGAKIKGKRIDIVMGLPASGKSSIVVKNLIKQHGSMVIDSDIVKEYLPEFRHGLGAGVVHLESSDYIAENTLLEKALENGDNIVLPLIGKDLGKMQAYIRELTELGHEVHLHYVDIPPMVAAKRSMSRMKETGRFVDPAYILNEVGLTPKENYAILKHEKGLQSYAAYDNNVPIGEKAKLIEKSQLELGNKTGRRNIADNQKSETKPQEQKVNPHQEVVDTIREALYSGDTKAAQALHDSFSQDHPDLPAFDKLKQEMDKVHDSAVKQLDTIKKDLLSEKLSTNPDDPTNQLLKIAQQLQDHFSRPKAKFKLTGTERTYTSADGKTLLAGGTASQAFDRLIHATDIEGFKSNISVLHEKFDGVFTDMYDTIRRGGIDGGDYDKFRTYYESIEGQRIGNKTTKKPSGNQAAEQSIESATSGTTLQSSSNSQTAEGTKSSDTTNRSAQSAEARQSRQPETRESESAENRNNHQSESTNVQQQRAEQQHPGNRTARDGEELAVTSSQSSAVNAGLSDITERPLFNGGEQFKYDPKKDTGWFSTSIDKSVAEEYAKRKGGVVNELYLPKDAQVLDALKITPEMQVEIRQAGYNPKSQKDIIEWADIEKDYDAVDFSGLPNKGTNTDREVAVINASKLLTKEQRFSEELVTREKEAITALQGNSNRDLDEIQQQLVTIYANTLDYFDALEKTKEQLSNRWGNKFVREAAVSDLKKLYNHYLTGDPLANLTADVSRNLAYAAHNFTSFSPDIRAEQEISSYVQEMTNDYHALEGYAKTEDAKKQLNELFIKYRAGYAARVRDELTAKSRTASTMITGGSGFNVGRNERMLSRAHAATETVIQYRDYMLNKIKNTLSPTRSISSDDPRAIAKLQDKLTNLQKKQELMVKANKIIRSKKDVLARLQSELGIKEETAQSILKPDSLGRVGFPSYALQNNNAGIKSVQERIARMQKIVSISTQKDLRFSDGKLHFNQDINRLQIHFDSKPDDAMIKQLRQSAFKWNPTNKVWQRQLTPNAIYTAKRILNITHEITIEQPEEQPSTKPRDNSVILGAGINPGLDKFINEDVIPKSKGSIQWIKDAKREFLAGLNPTSLVDERGLNLVFTYKGNNDLFKFLNREKYKNYRLLSKQVNLVKYWDHYSIKDHQSFYDNYENASTQPSHEWQALDQLYRSRYDTIYDKLSAFKHINKIENYFRRVWDLSGGSEKEFKTFFNAKRGLQGDTSWSKQRFYQFYMDAVKAGKVAKETNPEIVTQWAEEGAERFVNAQELWKQAKAAGKLSFVKFGKQVPNGFAKINDKIATVYFPQELANGGTVVTKSGEWYGEEHFVRLINNHLSSDKWSRSSIGKLMQSQKAVMNGFQLFGIFHPQFLGWDTMANSLNIAQRQAMSGNFKDLPKTFGKTPLRVIDYYLKGNQVIKKALAYDPEALAALKLVAQAGSKVINPENYQATVLDNFKRNVVQGNYFGALLRSPYAGIEAFSRPLFNDFIPKAKLGVFFENYGQALMENAEKLATGEVDHLSLARPLWRDVEDRMGELNYDNLFWDNTFKGVVQTMMRAPGWFKGTLATFGGGIKDNAKFLGDTSKYFFMKGDKPHFTQRGQYFFNLLFVIMAGGAIYQYLHTGKKPQELKDYFMPMNGATDSNGNAIRILFATYFKDAISIANNPFTYVENKAAPEINLLLEEINNRDFFGNYVHNPHDPLWTKIMQSIEFAGSEAFTPFSAQQLQQQTSDAQKLEMLSGIMKAPAKYIQSAKQQQAQEEYEKIHGVPGPKTPEQVQLDRLKAKARQEIKQNGWKNSPTFKQLMKDGTLKTQQQRNNFVKSAYQSSMQRMESHLPRNIRAQLSK